MGIKRLLSIFSFTLLFSALIIFAAIAGFFIYAPGYLESKVIPDLIKKAGINIFALDLRNVGIYGAELSDIRLGDGIVPGIGIDSIRVDYSPSGLFNRKIKKVVLSGISIPMEYKDKEISIKGLDLSDTGDGSSSEGFSIGAIEIRYSRLLLSWGDKKLDIPFDMDAIFIGQGFKPERVLLNLYPRGQVLKIACAISHDRESISMSILSEDLLLDAFSDIINDATGLDAGGVVNLNIATEVSYNQFKPSDINASMQFNRCDIMHKGLLLAGNYNDGIKDSPILIQLKSGDFKSWEFNISRFLLHAPIGSFPASAEGSLNIEEEAIDVEAVFQTGFPAKNSNSSGKSLKGIIITNAPSLIWKTSAVIENSGAWQVKTDITGSNTQKTPTVSLLVNDTSISSGTPEVHLKAKTKDTDISASYSIMIPVITVDNKTSFLTIPEINVSSQYKGLYKDPWNGKASFSLNASGIEVNSGDISANAPGVDINGTLDNDAKGNVSITGDLAFSDAGVSIPNQGISVGGISGNIPFQQPFKMDGKPGYINVESLKVKDIELGSLNSEVQHKKNNLVFEGKYISGLFSDLIISISGSAGLSDGDINALISIDLPDYEVPPDTDLSLFAPELKDISFQGLISASADISLSGKGPDARLNIGIQGAQVKAAGKELVLEGISGELDFRDIFSFKSAPEQLVKISNISFKELKADNFSANFQIESRDSIFIEQCRFNWCQGHVSIQPFRVIPGVDDYRFTLNCDRLNLASIMEQFGVAKASGNGAVNGTIPLVLSNGQLTFEDGFLYSTPGVGGNIHVTGTEALTAGLPADSDQYMQMEIAREALKDFEYEWAKMTLNTEGTDLLMKLQFDGKPANPLPFVYERDIGKFIKLETDGKGSTFEGISLDINFRLPLNEILEYKDLLF